jgi:NAD(P)-dependent dehydrogenase (short-subunit alcohol dehydrogenase family)
VAGGPVPCYAGKRVVVTGAGRGIGRTLALAFAAAGADVALVSRTEAELRSVATQVEALGRTAVVIIADICDADGAGALVERARAGLGGLDVLVSNAGGWPAVDGSSGPLGHATPAAFDATYRLNVRGPLFVALAAAAVLADQGRGGSILNIASINGIFPAPGQALYGSAKAALVSLTAALAYELGAARIRVNALAPGLIETPMTQHLLREEEARWARTSFYPLGRFGRPEDVAAAALYLCSDEAGWISGITLPVHGGQHATLSAVRWLERGRPRPPD